MPNLYIVSRQGALLDVGTDVRDLWKFGIRRPNLSSCRLEADYNASRIFLIWEVCSRRGKSNRIYHKFRFHSSDRKSCLKGIYSIKSNAMYRKEIVFGTPKLLASKTENKTPYSELQFKKTAFQGYLAPFAFKEKKIKFRAVEQTNKSRIRE